MSNYAYINAPSAQPHTVLSRKARSNRRNALRSALWPVAKGVVTLAAIFVKEAVL